MIANFETFPVNQVKKRFDLILFFVLAYLIAWVSFAMELIIQDQKIELILFNDFNLILFIFQTITKFGPTLAGLVITIWLGKPVVKDLFSRQIDFSKPKKFYLVAFFLPPVIMLLAISITILLDSSVMVTLAFPGVLLGLIYWLSLRFFFGGGLGEELGFRGFALTRLLASLSPLKAAFYVGLLWTFWHAPGWIFTYDATQGIVIRSFGNILVSLLLQFVFTVSLSFLFTLLFIKAEANILTVSILHGSLNGFSAFFERELFNLLDNDLWVILYILCFVVIGIICVFYLRKSSELLTS